MRITRSKVGAFVVLLLVATATVTTAGAAQSQAAQSEAARESLSANDASFEEASAVLEADGVVRLWVQFESDDQSFAGVQLQRATVAGDRAAFEATLNPQAHVTQRLLTIASLAITIRSLGALDELRTNPLVRSVIVAPELRLSASQHVNTAGFFVDSAASAVGIDELHALGLRGEGQRIAIVDTGIDPAHPALDHAIVYERCILDAEFGRCPNGRHVQSGDGAARDDTGHGTSVAGTIVSDGTGASRVGVAPAAELEVFKVIGAPTSSGEVIGSLFDIAAALDWIYVNRPAVDVVNLSLGTDRLVFGGDCLAEGNPVAEAIDQLVSRGVLVVAAAGNDFDTGGMIFPACYRGTMAVAATSDSATLAGFSNISAGTDVAAPGVSIFSTARGGGNSTVQGTSFAAPIVAGCALLLHQAGIADLALLRVELETSTASTSRGGYRVPFLTCAPNAVLCDGQLVTVDIGAGQVPTSGPDVIRGTSAGETINGAGGNDVICAGGGNDIVFGGGGNDTIYGQSGNDQLAGGVGDDVIFGNSGNDVIFGNDGKDRVVAGDGADVVDGGNGNDRIYGRSGNDQLTGGAGSDAMYGEAGLDRLLGGPGADYLSGGPQLDRLFGQQDNDTIVGDGDNDVLVGGDGDDVILGAAGKDEILGQAGDDTLTGNGGSDSIRGGDGNDRLVGSSGSDFLYGGAGNDAVFGRAGNDRVFGEAGNDDVYGEAGNDIVNGGTGTDTCSGGSGVDTLVFCS